jgi:outer membrane protein OmpA-like peptidoglycan-associated protein
VDDDFFGWRPNLRDEADNAKLAKQQYVRQICIKGVTDKQGDAKANERLAQQRAQAVAGE